MSAAMDKENKGENGGNSLRNFDFDKIERAIIESQTNPSVIGFGNPHSKLTELEQFHLWKKMIQEGSFVDRDDFCNKMQLR